MPSTCEPPPPTPLPEGDEARCESIACPQRAVVVQWRMSDVDSEEGLGHEMKPEKGRL